jgi:dienelactone hydrolase
VAGRLATALRGRRGGALALGVAAALAVPAPAPATIPETLHDPSNCEAIEPAPGFSVLRCDDGTPTAGGTTANEGGTAAVTVPAEYAGYRRLPKRAEDATSKPGADSEGNVALDASVTLPATSGRRVPLVVMMHGCCAGSKTNWQADTFDAPGERWHYSDSWFAARGYAVITYTSRGFVNGSNQGSTGETQLDSRSYEINDYQHLACQVTHASRRGLFDDVTGERIRVDPRRVVVTGGSYGGGFSWLALTDPRWRCPAQAGAGKQRMRVRAVAPKYGWTDLVHSLVPTGLHTQRPGDLPDPSGCDSGPVQVNGDPCKDPAPIGLVKRSIVAGLYASGKTGVPPGSSHTTFPPEIDQAISCLEGTYPPVPGDPNCENVISQTLPEFLRERSAYYQDRFFRKAARRPSWRIPVWNAAAFTDPLFPPTEHVRMVNRLRSISKRYPVQTYQGDFQHFVQNKDKEWADVCETEDRHRCRVDEYVNGFNRAPANRVSVGATTMLNRFIDHYARPAGNPRQGRPKFNVTAALQICPENAGQRPADEPGPRFKAATFDALSRGTERFSFEDTQTTTSLAAPNPHAVAADPVGNQAANGRRCAPGDGPAGPGVATYTTEPLGKRRTLIGPTRIAVDFDVAPPTATGLQLNARLYDVAPGGDSVLVDRGPRVLTPEEIEAGRVVFWTHGNGWRFEAGHSVRVELAQDDEPFVHRTDSPFGLSSLSLSSVDLALPVRERLP